MGTGDPWNELHGKGQHPRSGQLLHLFERRERLEEADDHLIGTHQLQVGSADVRVRPQPPDLQDHVSRSEDLGPFTCDGGAALSVGAIGEPGERPGSLLYQHVDALVSQKTHGRRHQSDPALTWIRLFGYPYNQTDG